MTYTKPGTPQRARADHERYTALRLALFDNHVKACAHLVQFHGLPQPITTIPQQRALITTPYLCYRHTDEGIMCAGCLVRHVIASHTMDDLPQEECDGCGKQLPEIDPRYDLDAHIALMRRSVAWTLTVNDSITIEPPPHHDQPSQVITYAPSKTVIIAEHLQCFTCLAEVNKLI
jgi:hypothetical protein